MRSARYSGFAVVLALSLLGMAALPVAAFAEDGVFATVLSDSAFHPEDQVACAGSATDGDEAAHDADDADYAGAADVISDDGAVEARDYDAFGPLVEEDVAEVTLASSSDAVITLNGTMRYDFAAQQLTLLNNERSSAGKNRLVMNSTLQKVAMQRAAEAAVYFSHTRPNGTKWSTAIPSSVDWYSIGENLAMGQTTPAAVTTAWMNSAGHKQNMLSGDYTSVGIGCFYYGGTYYWAQTFADAGSESYVSKSSQSGSETIYVSYSTVSKATVDKVLAQGSSSSSSSSGSSSGGSGSDSSGSSSGSSKNTSANTMYRLYNRYTGEHFYTADAAEVSKLDAVGWDYEGISWYAPKSSSTPVYRLYNKYAPGGDHHYTLDEKEVEECKKAGWTYEGIGWYSADTSDGVPLYRVYNPYASVGTHHYTTSWAEISGLREAGWNYEGISWYGNK
ncbi:CAP domain-containing protein [Paratractidigestivibacter sp.]|uniref:CAP domain-containing protein n=1 Tax=Paratractidigestivibacter sp. TaxID=2847316 RepID=UPI002ABD361E|nr:CAP domain-containing protein [Paratractidigestivibacter sp.]